MTMHEVRLTLAEWLVAYDEGKFSNPDFRTQCDAGWYDWFCKETSLARKLAAMAPKVRKIAKSPKIDPNTCYVWFKNNCPIDGSLYDDFRIADLATGDTLYTITPRSGHNRKKGQSEVWSADNDFDGPVVQGAWSDVLNYFGVK